MAMELAVRDRVTLPEAVEAALVQGDLAKLSTVDRIALYDRICESLGLNRVTQPFQYLTLNGKLVLYATRNCTDQLRAIHNVTVAISNRERIDDVYVVTARATTPSGRSDESTGAVTLGSLKGDALCNALMKAETKAKRRVTLSIIGLSLLDESEIETIREARVTPMPELRGPRDEVVDAAETLFGADSQGLPPLAESFAARLERMQHGDTQAFQSFRDDAKAALKMGKFNREEWEELTELANRTKAEKELG